MAKQIKKSSFKIPDFFGTCNSYRIFALQSDYSAFPFANHLGHSLHTTFRVLPDFEYLSNQYNASFTVFYAQVNQEEAIHCLLLENKTTNFNQKNLFISKTEKKLPFQTLFLFDESLYLFNNEGLRCFDLEFANMDYLLLLFSNNNIENKMFTQFLNHIAPFMAQDVSFLLEREQTSAEARIVSFLRDFYCKYEVKANQFSRRKERDYLSSVKQIPNQNLQYPIPILLENDAINDNLQLSNEYVKFLEEE